MTDAQIITVLFRDFPYAVAGSLVAGLLCGYLGVYVVSKRVVFVSATLTQVAVTGIAVSHYLLPHTSSEWGAMAMTLLAVLFFAWVLRSRRVPRDSVLGTSFVAALAFRILVIQKSPAAEVAEIETILKGDLLFVTPDQFIFLAVAAAAILIVHLLFQKEFLFVSFDAETATTQGFHASRWELVFYLTIGVTISVATRIVGDVFVFGFLVVPAVTAIVLAKRVRNIFALGALFGVLPPLVGLWLAFRLDLPAGPTTVGVSVIVLCLSWIIRRAVR